MNFKYTQAEKKAVLRSLDKGFTYGFISDKTGVSESTIYNWNRERNNTKKTKAKRTRGPGNRPGSFGRTTKKNKNRN